MNDHLFKIAEAVDKLARAKKRSMAVWDKYLEIESNYRAIKDDERKYERELQAVVDEYVKSL